MEVFGIATPISWDERVVGVAGVVWVVDVS